MSYSARGDREHCIGITTARQKNQHFRWIERIAGRIDTTCCALTRAPSAREPLHDAIVQDQMQTFQTARKCRWHKGFRDARRFPGGAEAAMRAPRVRATRTAVTTR